MDDLSHPVILCIDDKATVAETELLRSVLETAGHRVLIASSAKTAFEVLRQHEINLILMEQRVPTGIRNCSLAELLKRVKPDVPVAIYTADWTQSPEDLRVADVFLTKLVSVEELLSTMKRLLDNRLTQERTRERFQPAYALGRFAA
ncbi:MAG TPA: response regulator [Candidatus Angelobacter sp.]